jgi:LPS-assembly protein
MIYICFYLMKRLRKIRSIYLFYGIITAVILFTVTWKTAANGATGKMFYSPLTTQQEDSNKLKSNPAVGRQLPINPSDTNKLKRKDSTRVVTDTFSVKLSKDSLDAPVRYQAEDSAVVLILEKKIILYGKTKIEHKTNVLTAPMIEMDQQTSILTAVNRKDSTGLILETANFTDGNQSFTSDTIRFNFKTQRGLTKNTYTSSGGEMYVFAEKFKKVDSVTTFAQRVRFTTCNLDEPHFAFLSDKMKLINKKVAVSGPTHPEFEGVPVPIYLPFGFFPLSQGRHSGLLPPQVTNNEQMGIGLEGLGYYKVLNDYWDAKLYGNIYSYGGWSANLNPTYRKRYRYAGAFNLSMQTTKQNFKGDPDYVKSNTYFVTWNHAVDSRARPGTTFSANVNAGSTKYNQFIPNNTVRNFQNQLGSSIAYSKSWKDKPYNLTISANHNQNNLTHLINVSLPDMGFTINTLYPFQKKEFFGAPKWYEKLGIGYTGTFRNQFSFYDTNFSFKQLIDTMQWGALHNLPITLSLPPIFGGALIVAPSVSYSQVWIAQKMRMKWNTPKQKLDTVSVTKGFFVDHSANFSLGFSTAVFGTYQFKNKKVVAIRHVIRPSLSMNYKPDLSSSHYYTDTVYSGYTSRLSEFQGSLYGGFSEGQTGGISFQLDNNLEMKVRNKDSSDTKNNTHIVHLIDGFGLSTGYNFLRDSLKLDYINLYFRTNLFEKININASGTLNPYKSDTLGRDIDKFAWTGANPSLGRISNASVTVSTSFQSKPKDAEKEKKKQEAIRENLETPELRDEQKRLLEYAKQNPGEFVDFNIPWSINLSYSLNYYQQLKPNYSGYESKFSSNINFNGSFNLTPKWNFSVNGAFDFDTKAIQYFTMAISREMHCWQMSINATPIGLYRYFNISISPKASILQDLKLNRTRSFNSF